MAIVTYKVHQEDLERFQRLCENQAIAKQKDEGVWEANERVERNVQPYLLSIIDELLERRAASPAILPLEKDAAAGDEVLSKLEGLLIPGELQLEEDLDDYADIVVDYGEGSTGWIAGRVGIKNARSIVKLCNAAPALLARVRTAEANLAAALNTLNAHNAPGGLPSLYERGEAAAGQWVSVQERLPEGEHWSESVLTLWNSGSMTVQPWYNGGDYHKAYLHHAGRFLDELPYEDEGQAYVTHWQPLPAAPATPTTLSKEASPAPLLAEATVVLEEHGDAKGEAYLLWKDHAAQVAPDLDAALSGFVVPENAGARVRLTIEMFPTAHV